MSTYIDSLILLLLGWLLFPDSQLSAFHLCIILLLLALYCFELVNTNNTISKLLGGTALFICLFVPATSVFLPLMCYTFFYRKQFAFPCIYIIPILLYLTDYPASINYAVLLLAALSFYLAHNSAKCHHLQETIRTFRDASVEQEMSLKQINRQLLESQNDQIYIATLKERNRIAREIHDNVGHLLSRSILQVGAMLAICKDETVKPHLETLKDSLDNAMNSIRNSVHDLHDESIDLEHALQNLTASYTFCTANLDCEVSKHVPKEIKYCFLAIVKEALNNTTKHSNATKINITVKEHPAFYQLLVEDNGTKKTASATSTDSSGIGLSNMHDRVNTLHGIIHISNERGYRIFVSVPK